MAHLAPQAAISVLMVTSGIILMDNQLHHAPHYLLVYAGLVSIKNIKYTACSLYVQNQVGPRSRCLKDNE